MPAPRLTLFASGRSYHATRWANALAARGAAVRFLTIHPFERPLDDAVERVLLPGRGRLGYVMAARTAAAELRAWRPDLVHAHYATGYGLLSLLANRTIGIPRLVSLYGSDVYEFSRRSFLHRWLLGMTTGSATTVLSASHAMAEAFRACFPRQPRPQVIPFGVDVQRFQPAAERRPGTGLHIGMVKKLEPKYGVDILLHAVRQLVDGGLADIKVTIVGEGAARPALEALAQSLGVSRQVCFRGVVPNEAVPAVLRELDIFVVPSRSESFGVAAVEAQACGIAVVATNVGGLPEVVVHDETGLVVPCENPTALAEAIAVLAADRERREAMGRAGRQRVLTHYDWSHNVDTMMQVYRDTLEVAGA